MQQRQSRTSIRPGDYILIDEFSRLTRETETEALHLLTSITRKNVRVVTLVDQDIVARPDRPGVDHAKQDTQLACVAMVATVCGDTLIPEAGVEVDVGVGGTPLQRGGKLAAQSIPFSWARELIRE